MKDNLNIQALTGPILVIGAGGFLGANLFRRLYAVRKDVFGTIHSYGSWRLENIPSDRLCYLDLLSYNSISDLIHKLKVKTIFNCSAYGAYSFENDYMKIHRTNYEANINLLEICSELSIEALISSGSSSEYGINCKAPAENTQLAPDSQYAVSKAALAGAVSYYGKIRKVPCAHLRLYSLYGPYEDASRLMPVLSSKIAEGTLPPFVAPETSRDFVFVDDAVDAFIAAAAGMRPEVYGEAYNIGTGVRTSIRELAELAVKEFSIKESPRFAEYAARKWDHDDWYGNPAKFEAAFGWKPATTLPEGLRATVNWWKSFLGEHDIAALTKKKNSVSRNSVSAIIACYRDNQAIPVMYERLTKMFNEQRVDYEIIFVNDCSPDDSSEVIRRITEHDPHVLGIEHSRNFGSQSAFLSGLEVATKEAAVIMDGDLQDPPEMIAKFIGEWRRGADVVYGVRTRREMPRRWEFLYKGFYWLFAEMSEVRIPRNTGDFSLLDARVVRELVRCPERDYFLRGIRAYVGFKQIGVEYFRPERMFGHSTNNLVKNIGWAKKAIFSFSRLPLHWLSAIGAAASAASILLAFSTIAIKIFRPELAPKGISLLVILISIFGSFNLLGLGLLGEYIGKIMEETKARPRYIRRKEIRNGNIRDWRNPGQ